MGSIVVLPVLPTAAPPSMDLPSKQGALARSILDELPDDIWRELLGRFEPKHIFALWRASNRLIYSKLARMVKSLILDDYHLADFVAIRSFKLQRLVLSSLPYPPTAKDLLALPSTIEDLSFSFQTAQVCWFHPVPSSPPTYQKLESVIKPIFLDTLFPNLQALHLMGSSSDICNVTLANGVTQMFQWNIVQMLHWIRRLPKSLTLLRLPIVNNKATLQDPSLLPSDLASIQGFEHLPRLQSLIVDHLFRSEGPTLVLPPSLELLHLPEVNVPDLSGASHITDLTLAVMPIPNRTGDLLKLLPPHLTAFSCRLAHVEDISDYSALSPTITRLTLRGELLPGDLAQKLPSTLRDLTVLHAHFDWTGLPPALTRFRAGPDDLGELGWYGRTASAPPKFAALPAGLTSLQYMFNYQLPKESALDIPLGLQQLRLPNCTVSSAWLANLPAALRASGGLQELAVRRILYHIEEPIVINKSNATLSATSSQREVVSRNQLETLSAQSSPSDPSSAAESLISNGSNHVESETLSLYLRLPQFLHSRMMKTFAPSFRFQSNEMLLHIDAATFHRYLPTGLTSLALTDVTETDLMALTLNLPPTLKELSIFSSSSLMGHVASLPNLRKLNIDSHLPDASDVLHNLPPYLLHFSSSTNLIITNELDQLPHALLSLTLTRATKVQDKCIAKLPRTLQSLQLPATGDALTDLVVDLLPPKLTSLRLNQRHWSIEALSRLPPTLTSLRLHNKFLRDTQILQRLQSAHNAAEKQDAPH